MKPGRKNDRPRQNFSSNFQQQAEQAQPSLIMEFVDFILHNKKWWLAPIVIMLLLLGLLAVIGGSGAAPFIYTLF